MGSTKDLFMQDREEQQSNGGNTPVETGLSPVQKLMPGLFGFTPSKVDVLRFQENIRLSYEAGEISALEVMARAKLAQKYIEAIVGDSGKNKGIVEIKEGARDEAERYGAPMFKYMGMEVELRNHGSKNLYGETGDPVYLNLQAQMETLKARIKDREEWLKGLKVPTEVTDTETAEVVVVTPVLNRSTPGLTFSLK